MGQVVVTGADGFIGKRLVARLLREGWRVTVLLHRKPAWGGDSSVRVVHGDVTNPATLRGKFEEADHVIHLAGCTLARFPKEFERVNGDGTLNVARECQRSKQQPRFIFVSSSAVGGPTESGVLNTESRLPAPVSNYGWSKWKGECGLHALENDLPISIVRPPSVIGEDDPYLLKLFQGAAAGWIFLAGTHHYHYSFIHVDDLVSILLFLMNRDPKPRCVETFYAAQGPPMTFCEFGRIVRTALGLEGEARVVKIPFVVCQTVGWINSALGFVFNHRPLLNHDKIREARGGNWCCSEQLLLEAGFKFQMSIEARIRETTHAYWRKGWLNRQLLTQASSCQ